MHILGCYKQYYSHVFVPFFSIIFPIRLNQSAIAQNHVKLGKITPTFCFYVHFTPKTFCIYVHFDGKTFCTSGKFALKR